MHLGGRKIELAELYKEMTECFAPGKKVEVPEDLPDNVFVTFAEDDPIRVDCQDGRVRLTIHITELVQQGTRNRWTNFSVHAYYAPSADQLDANLYRDGIIELIGDNRPLPLGQRTGLTAIFARVLSRNRKLHIINQQLAAAPALRDQQVTQFVIHDGWIGVARYRRHPTGRRSCIHVRRCSANSHLKNATAFSKIASPSPRWCCLRVQRGCCVGSMCRSGCGIRPKTRPVSSHRPATFNWAPFGFAG